ncbi:MAG TPA: helix-turn-helix domain-containing protein, partial [Candidatus Limnocylindria bacterium]|nr:helix-turn-helix domain-containing protein [Candidatus Limnocylindria bacterium]
THEPDRTTASLRDRKKEQARSSLVDAAIRLFEERGIDATSTDDIAAAVGLSRATFFNYFPYKEAILVEIGARFVAGISAHAALHRRRSPRQALYDLADAVAAIAAEHQAVVPYVAREMTHPEPERREYAEERMQYPMLYEALLSQLGHAGMLRSRARRQSYGRQLVDLTTGALVRAGRDFPIEELRRELRANVDVFCAGALRDPVESGRSRTR